MNDNTDTGRIDRAVPALPCLTQHGAFRAWNSRHRDALDRLHKKRSISGPASKAHSVGFTGAGCAEAERPFRTDIDRSA